MNKYEELAKQMGIEYLNQFPDNDEGWANDYILRAETVFDSGVDGKEFFDMFRVITFLLHTDDEGGPASVMLFLDSDDKVHNAVWGFDGHADPMASRAFHSDTADADWLAYHIYPNNKLAADDAPRAISDAPQ